MKILVQTGSFYPAQEGGPTNAVYWLASGLASCGYEVHVVASSKGLPENVQLDVWQELNGFQVIYNSPGRGQEIISREMDWSEYLIRSGVCQLHAHWSNLQYIKKGKKLIVSPRGELFYPAIFHKGKIYGLIKLMFFKIIGLLYGSKIIYHATSEDEKNQIRKVFGKAGKVFVVPNYMIIPDYVDDSIRVNQYQDLIYVGRISPIKALDKLIRALYLSKSFMISPSKLIILGDCSGEYYNQLREMIERLGMNDKIEFKGVVTGHKKDVMIANSRYLILVSESENFGNVVIEALAQGTPVIASKGTPWSSLSDNNAGFWTSNNPQELSSVISSSIDMDDASYYEQRRNAYNFSKKFDVFSNMESWKSILHI